jgi:hypothetical protein
MNGQAIAIIAIGVICLVAIAVFFLRRKDSISGGVDIRGVGKGQFKAGNNPRDAVIREADGGRIRADAPQGSATIEKAKARGDISATAGGTRDPKA